MMTVRLSRSRLTKMKYAFIAMNKNRASCLGALILIFLDYQLFPEYNQLIPYRNSKVLLEHQLEYPFVQAHNCYILVANSSNVLPFAFVSGRCLRANLLFFYTQNCPLHKVYPKTLYKTAKCSIDIYCKMQYNAIEGNFLHRELSLGTNIYFNLWRILKMFCSKCGKEINDEAVVCVHCGCATGNFEKDKKEKEQPIIINNNNSASSSASAAASAGGRIRRRHSLLFDIFMIFITCGLWIIWMIVRPKYY